MSSGAFCAWNRFLRKKLLKPLVHLHDFVNIWNVQISGNKIVQIAPNIVYVYND